MVNGIAPCPYVVQACAACARGARVGVEATLSGGVQYVRRARVGVEATLCEESDSRALDQVRCTDGGAVPAVRRLCQGGIQRVIRAETNWVPSAAVGGGGGSEWSDDLLPLPLT